MEKGGEKERVRERETEHTSQAFVNWVTKVNMSFLSLKLHPEV